MTHVMVTSLNHKCILKTTERTFVTLCENDNMEIKFSDEIMTSIPSTINETKLVALRNDFFYKTFPCPTCMSLTIPDEDDIIECSCGVIASMEAAIPCSSVKITILDDQKHQLDLQVKLEQPAIRKT